MFAGLPVFASHLTREEIEAKLPPPCCYCGARERFIDGRYVNPDHDFSKHPGMEPRRTERMSDKEFIGATE